MQSDKNLKNQDLSEQNKPTHQIQRMMRINADDQNRRKLFCFWFVLLLFLLLIILLCAFALPSSTIQVNAAEQIIETDVQKCNGVLILNRKQNIVECQIISNGSNITKSGQFINRVAELNQFVLFYIQPKNREAEAQIRNKFILFSLYKSRKIKSNSSTFPSIKIVENISIDTKIKLNKHDKINDRKEQAFFVGYTSHLHGEDQFFWEVSLQSINQNFLLKSVMINDSFTLFTIILRVVLFCLSVIVALQFNRKIIRIPYFMQSMQQKLIRLLSVATLAFNDQFYFITILWPNPFTTFYSTFVIANFVLILFIIWVMFLSRIRFEEGKFSSQLITKFKVFVAGFFYLAILALSLTVAYYHTNQHPFLSTNDIEGSGVVVAKVFGYLAFTLGILYITYLYIRIFKEKLNKLWRSSLFMLITFFFVIIIAVLFYWGGFNIFNYSVSQIMLALCLSNAYSFYLQYMYCPTNEQLIKIKNGQAYIEQKRLNKTQNMSQQGEIQIQISGFDDLNKFQEMKEKDEKENIRKRIRRRRQGKQRKISDDQKTQKIQQVKQQKNNDSIELQSVKTDVFGIQNQ